MSDDDEQLELELRDALVGRPGDPRQSDVERLRRLAAQRASETDRERPGLLRGPRVPHWALGAAAAGVVIVSLVAGMRLGGGRGAGSTAGVTEFSARLGVAGQGSIDLDGRKTGIGRVLRITSNDIPVLPTGEFYEVWFIAPDDTVAHPDRISAGTFHPDAKGHTDVSLTAAVDPSKYPVLAITAEAGDGNPAASTTEVTRGPLSIRGG